MLLIVNGSRRDHVTTFQLSGTIPKCPTRLNRSRMPICTNAASYRVTYNKLYHAMQLDSPSTSTPHGDRGGDGDGDTSPLPARSKRARRSPSPVSARLCSSSFAFSIATSPSGHSGQQTYNLSFKLIGIFPFPVFIELWQLSYDVSFQACRCPVPSVSGEKISFKALCLISKRAMARSCGSLESNSSECQSPSWSQRSHLRTARSHPVAAR
jgi:hypothetical protein